MRNNKNPFISVCSLSDGIATSSGKTITPQRIKNVLYFAKIYSRTARTNPFINETNKQKRPSFAKAYIIISI